MTKDKALKMAIEAMDLYDYTGTQKESELYTKAQKACKEALEQPADKKPHEIREHVNRLRDIAKDFGQTQQLRDRISREVIEFHEALEQPSAQEQLTSLDEIFADEMFRLNRDIVPLPEHLIHEIAQRNYHPALGINAITFARDLEKAHGIGEQ